MQTCPRYGECGDFEGRRIEPLERLYDSLPLRIGNGASRLCFLKF
jgi:hypothetical protein